MIGSTTKCEDAMQNRSRKICEGGQKLVYTDVKGAGQCGRFGEVTPPVKQSDFCMSDWSCTVVSDTHFRRAC